MDALTVTAHASGLSEATLQLIRLADDMLETAHRRFAPTFSIDCDLAGGQASAVLNDLDSDDQLSAGDTLDVTFDHCHRTELDDRAHGRLLLTIAAGGFDPDSTRNQLSVDVRFSSFVVRTDDGDVGIVGALTYVHDESKQLSIVQSDTGSIALQFTIGGYVEEIADHALQHHSNVETGTFEYAYTGRLISGFYGGYVDVDTTQPLVASENSTPREGTLALHGRHSTHVRISAQSNRSSARFDSVDTNGDGQSDLDIETITSWRNIFEGPVFGFGTFFWGAPRGSDGRVIQTTQRPLASAGHALVVDDANRHAYISLPEAGEIQVIDLTDMTVVRTLVTGGTPRGLALSQDGRSLYVAMQDDGAVAVITLPDNGIDFIDVLAAAEDPTTWDVIEPVPGKVLVSTNGGLAHIALIERGDTNQVSRVASERIIRGRPLLAQSPTGRYVYIGEGFHPNSLYTLDTTITGMPIVLEDDHGAVSGTPDHLEISADGTRIYTGSGQVLSSETFAELGLIAPGPSRTSGLDTWIDVADAPGQIRRFDSEFFSERDRIRHDCDLAEATAMELGPEDGTFYLLAGQMFCRIQR